MNTSQFYTENSLEDWKQVLGSKMHYHLGSQSNDDIFDQAIRNLYKHIPQNANILDCGCGWGGVANLLQQELNATVTGVTNSLQQYHYTAFPTHHTDIHDFIPTEHYDVALFIESFCHFAQPNIVLNNIKSHTNKIIIKDYLWNTDWYNSVWQMYFRTQSSYEKLITDCGYTITDIYTDTTTDVYNSCLFWYNNIQTLPPESITGQIETLKILSQGVLEYGPNIQMLVIVAQP